MRDYRKERQKSRWAIIVKSNANYKCQKCGASENIQAHDPTRKHNNPKDGVCLCSKCHSEEHPEVPQKLFEANKQHYWNNISISTLARYFKVCSRTISRIAKKLNIGKGEISLKDVINIYNQLFIKHYSYSFICNTTIEDIKLKANKTYTKKKNIPNTIPHNKHNTQQITLILSDKMNEYTVNKATKLGITLEDYIQYLIMKDKENKNKEKSKYD